MSTRYHPLANCEVCPLYEQKTFVPSHGPDQADIVLVGEAPGRQEVRGGEPFTGMSGKLLNTILQNVEIDRDDLFITNVCLCRPKDNATPNRQAIEACRDRLEAEIASRQPKTVVTLGAVASNTILGTNQKISELRIGPPVKPQGSDYQVIPTFHPAASLYNADLFPDIVTDFQKIGVAHARVWNPPSVKVIDDKYEAISYLDATRADRTISELAIDIEVGIEKDIHFGHADQYHLLCIGLAHNEHEATVLSEAVCQSGGVLDSLGRLLEAKGIIAQNGKFDLAGLYHIAPQAELVFDTMLAHYCIDERRGTHGLERLSVEYLGSPSWKHVTSGYERWADIPREILYKYNAYDVSNTYRLRVLFQKEFDKDPLLQKQHDFLVRTSPTLMHMEMNGIAIDEEYLDQIDIELKDKLEELQNRLRVLAKDDSYNPNSWQQVQRVLKDIYKTRVKNTQKETIEVVRERAAEKQNMSLYEFCTYHLEYKRTAKLWGTYVKGIKTRIYKGRIHSSFLLHGTVTGRLSSRNPNLQNIPRGPTIRRQFVASTPNNVLLQADYRQAELRVVCCLARDAYLRDVFADGRDIHSEVATRFFGKGFTGEQRVRAKAVVFGLTYGREAYSLAAEFGIPVREAEEYIKTFFDLIPDTINWRESVSESVLSGKDLVTPFGRRRRFWLITGNNRNDIIKEAYAFLPQSTASDLNCEAANRLREAGYAQALRILVHDSIALEVPQTQAEQVAGEIRSIMKEVGRDVFDSYIDFPVDISWARSWGDIK